MRGERWLRQGKGLSSGMDLPAAYRQPPLKERKRRQSSLLVSQSGLLGDARPEPQCAVLPGSSPDRIRSADLLCPLLIPRLLLPSLIAHDALIRSIAPARVRSRCRSWLRLRHALLAAMLAALILHAFQIAFSGHRDQTLFSQHFPGQQARTSRAFLCRTMRSITVGFHRDAASARKPPIAWNPNPRRKF